MTGRTSAVGWANHPRAPRELNSTRHARQTRSERHVARLGLDAEFIEEPDEARVRALVVDDEAGVDRQRSVGRLDAFGLDVPAGRLAFEQPHLVTEWSA